MLNVIAIVGLSGVGKSTLLKSMATSFVFQHLQASAIIKDERDKFNSGESNVDFLRNLPIDDNQKLLVSGFSRSADPLAPLIVLDGHTIIDTPGGIVEISPEVFKSLGIRHFIFVAERAVEIVRRRESDPTRSRPQRSEEEIAHQQGIALAAALRSALELEIPLTVIMPGRHDAVAEIMRSMTVSGG